MADRMMYPQYNYRSDYHQIPGYSHDSVSGGASGSGYTHKVYSRGSGQSNILRRVLFLLFFVVSALITAEIVFRTVLAPRMAITQIVLESDLPMDKNEVLDLAGISAGDLYFSVDTNEIQQAFLDLPLTENAIVEKKFPGILKIVLTKRTPLVLATAEGGGGMLVVDAHGTVFERGFPNGYVSLPVISGFEISQVDLGSRLPLPMRSIIRDLEYLRMQHPVLFGLISEIEFAPVHEHRYDAVVYFTHIPVPIRMGSKIEPEKLSGIIRILEVLQRQGTLAQIQEIDFRGDDVVYTKREG